jgi:hypothetical protein
MLSARKVLVGTEKVHKVGFPERDEMFAILVFSHGAGS